MQISRRDALLGASAAVAVAGVPAEVAVKEALAGQGANPTKLGLSNELIRRARAVEEVEVFHAKMTEALAEEMRLDNAFAVALKAFRKVHPTPLVCIERLQPRERVWCEHEFNLEEISGANIQTMRNRGEHDRDIASKVFNQLDAAKAELQALQDEDKSLQETAGLGALGRRIEAANDRYFEFQRLFLESQAKAPRALLLRVREMSDDVEDGTYGRDIYDALLRDLEHMAGGARS